MVALSGIIYTSWILAHAHTLALRYIFEGKQQVSTDVFNVGIGNGLSVLEIIHAFESQTGEKLNYKVGSRRAGDIMAIYSDYSKGKKIYWAGSRNWM
jgi:UDP-glucose 4-epimerase